MKKIVFLIIVLSIIFYDVYQINSYYGTKKNIERNIEKKSNNIANIVKFFIKESLEKNYVIDEMFYRDIFQTFKKDDKFHKNYIVLDKNGKKLRGDIFLNFSIYSDKLKEIYKQKISIVEIENNGNYIILAGYREDNILMMKFEIPKELKQISTIDEFKEYIMQEGEISGISISKDSIKLQEIKDKEDTRVVKKSIMVNDIVNDDSVKYNIIITFDIKNYNRELKKNLIDIFVIMIITWIIIILLFYYNYLDKIYLETKEYLKDKEKDILLGSVAAGVAHEIRNPLNSINYSIEYIESYYENEKTKKYFDVIRKEIARIDSTLKEFLDMRKEINIYREKIYVNGILKESMELVKKEYEKNNIAVEFQEIEHISIMGDKNRLKEVFINILKNAKEALENIEDKKINIKILKDRIIFTDNGVGMSEEEMSKVFNLYFTTKKEGTGIGMFRVKKIVEAHNGEIKINSKKGHGTEICVIFKKKNRKLSAGV
jgi:signal transduction histidine kinase